MHDFFYGFTFTIKSLNYYIKYPKLIVYSIIPVILNLIVYGTIFSLTYYWLAGKSGDITGGTQEGAEWWQVTLHILIIILSFILLLIICYFLFIFLGSIITAPFNEKISQFTERIITGKPTDYNVGFIRDAYISIMTEIKKLLFYFSILVPIFLTGLIPAIGTTISFITGTLFSFYYNALDFLDYPMTRKMLSFRHKLKLTLKGGNVTMGFGCAAFFITFTPLLNVFFRPLLVITGTALYYDDRFEKS